MLILHVLPNDKGIIALEYPCIPDADRTHSGYTHEDNAIFAAWMKTWDNYKGAIKEKGVTCNLEKCLTILNEQYPKRKVFPWITSDYEIKGYTIEELK